MYWTDQILATLIVVTGLLFVFAIIFAFVVIGLRLKNKRVRSRWIRLETQWEDRVLDVLADTTSMSELTSHVDSRDELRFIDFLMRFVRQLRGAERATLRVIALPYLPAAAELLSSPVAEKRARAVLILSGLGGTEYESALLKALDDESPLVAMVAARALSNSEHVQYAGHILARSDRFERWSPRHLAAMFAAIGENAAPSLRATLADASASERARVVAAESLLQLRDIGAAAAAREIAQGWTPPNVLVAVLRLLAEVGSDIDAPVIRRSLASTHPAVRGAAMVALGSLGDETDIEVLARSLGDASPWVALNAAAALRAVGAVERLQSISQSSGRGAQAARELLERARA
jgi:HEAT repeat protein